jgi:hypothetical protein
MLLATNVMQFMLKMRTFQLCEKFVCANMGLLGPYFGLFQDVISPIVGWLLPGWLAP